MNALVDEQVISKVNEQNARKAAVEQATANLNTAKKQKSVADKKVSNIQKKYKNSKTLTVAQRKKMAAGQAIDTAGITNTKQLRIINAYNNALTDLVRRKQRTSLLLQMLWLKQMRTLPQQK